ncbi:hypothetical protein KQI63_05955 [bacterium]|nr:hypothetical protein [bacterium]
MSGNSLTVPDEIGYKVYDADSSQQVLVTAELQAEASEVFQVLNTGIMATATSLHRIQKRKLYLCYVNPRTQRPYQSFRDFAEGFGIGYNKALRYSKVAEEFGGSISRYLAEGDKSGNVATPNLLNSLSFTKLYELTKLSEEDREALTDTDELVRPDGTVITFGQLVNMTQRDLADEVKQLRNKNRDLEEEKALAVEERDQAAKRLKDLEETDDILKLYGEATARIQQLEGAVIAAEKAEETWQKVEDGVQNLLALAERIPTGTSEKIDLKGRRILEDIAFRVNKLLNGEQWARFGLTSDEREG